MTTPLPYEPFYTQPFLDCLEKHRDKQNQVLILVERILADPRWQSHLLGRKKGIDLRGKRSRHFGRNFVIIYTVCDDCITRGFRDQGYNDCAFCTGDPLKRVIFLAFGQHDDIYSQQWKAKQPEL